MSVKVSVIVPVYNAAKTLPACLGNLVHQTLEEIELILVNDASTDDSLQTLLDCEQAFSEKVLVVNLEKNLGAGGARNVGLSYASGDYIGFVDSDDIVDPTMYEKLYTLARSGDYDMVDCAYYNESTGIPFLQTAAHCTGTLDAAKRRELIAGGGYLWSRLFRRDLFEGFHFREHTILEDMETLMSLFMRTKRLGTTQELLYRYRTFDTSASKLSNPAFYHRAVRDAITATYHTMSSFTDYPKIQDAVEYSMVYLYQCGIVNALYPMHSLSELQRNVYLNELRELRTKYISIPYEENEYVRKKISKNDLALMLQNDKNH